MSLKIFEQSVFISAPPFKVGEAFFNVDCWKIWNPAIQKVELLETPKVGAIGRITPNRGGAQPFKITRVTPSAFLEWEREYELGTTLVQSYSVTKKAEGSIFTTRLHCDGNLAAMVAGIMRRRFTRDLEKQVAGLKDFCEKHWTQERRTVIQGEQRVESQQ